MTLREAPSVPSASGESCYFMAIFGQFYDLHNLFRYSGAGDELISPVYIAPTLPPYVERTWPEDEVTVFMVIWMILMLEIIINVDDANDDEQWQL